MVSPNLQTDVKTHWRAYECQDEDGAMSRHPSSGSNVFYQPFYWGPHPPIGSQLTDISHCHSFTFHSTSPSELTARVRSTLPTKDRS